MTFIQRVLPSRAQEIVCVRIPLAGQEPRILMADRAIEVGAPYEVDEARMRRS